MRQVLIGLLAVGLAVASARAQAQDAAVEEAAGPADAAADAAAEANEAEARALFARGRELASARRFSEAVDAFRRSRALIDRPSTAFNLAVCLFTLGLHLESIEVLEAYRAQADPVAEAEGIADAERMLSHARGSIAHLELSLLPAEARVTVDGVLLEGGELRRVDVNQGTHVVRVEAAGHAPSLSEIPVAASETARRAISLTSTRSRARLVVNTPADGETTLQVDGHPAALGAEVELDAGSHRVVLTNNDEIAVERDLELSWNEHRELWLELAPSTPPAQTDSGTDVAIWVGLTGGAVAVALGVALAVVLAPPTASPSGGSTGVVLTPTSRSSGLTVDWP